MSLITFETLRGRLFGLAYRMLGSRADAEDIVQETYVRWHQAGQDSIDNPEAWFWAPNRVLELAMVNGETGLCIRDGERLTATLSIATDGERIHAVYAVVNPDKLA